MSCYGGPEITNDGLVVYYDMNNTQKSWKGAPTTNLLTGPNTFTATYWSLQNMTRTSSTEIDQDGTATASLFTVTTGYTPLWRQTSGQTAGATFTMSGHFKAGTGTTVTLTLGNTGLTNYAYATFNLLTGAASTTGIAGTGTYINSAIFNLGNGWYRCSVTGIVDSSATLIRTDYVFPNSSTIYGCKMQLEVGSFATPFVDGTRSTSQALLDLTNNNTLTATSLTYASDNTFSFNGTSSYLIAPENSTLNTQTPSVEVWVKTNSLNQNGFFFEKGNVNTQYSLFQEGGYLIWRLHNGTSYTQISAVTATYINTSQYAHIVATYTSGARNLYINGVLVASDTAAFTIPTNANGCSIGVYGGYNGGRSYWYNGNIAIVKVYNKALSASEVTQNFNAVRGRYGI